MCECAGSECHYNDTDYREMIDRLEQISARVESISARLESIGQFFDLMAQHPLVKTMAAAQGPKTGLLARRRGGES